MPFRRVLFTFQAHLGVCGTLEIDLLLLIWQVFEKAHRCVKDNEDRDVLVVVVLDEIGLAEVSTHNPLKVHMTSI